MTGPLLVIDADALMHRAYHSMPPVKGHGGRPMNALLGFTAIHRTTFPVPGASA